MNDGKFITYKTPLFASSFKASFSRILRFDFGSVVFLVSKFSMSLSIASVKVSTVRWFLVGSPLHFFGITFFS